MNARSAVRASAIAGPFAVLFALLSCGGESAVAGGPAPPPGVGYGSSSASDEPHADVRVLSRDDCLALRDHQIEIAVASALGDAGTDEGKRLELEARLRAEMKGSTDEWVKGCSGRIVEAKTLRCWKDATTPKTLLACEPAPTPSASTTDAATKG